MLFAKVGPAFQAPPATWESVVGGTIAVLCVVAVFAVFIVFVERPSP